MIRLKSVWNKRLVNRCLVVLGIGLIPAALSAAADSKAKVKPYPLDTCLVSGKKLDLTSSKLYSFNYKGQQIVLCCQGCEDDFKKDSAKLMAKVNAAAKKVKPYPLKSCVVSGEPLGEMGDPYVFITHHQEVKLCCKGCLKKFAKDPDAYLKKIK